MAEFEYNLLIIHNDTNAQEFLVRLFSGEIPGNAEISSTISKSREFVGAIEFVAEEPNKKVTRKLHLRTADSVVDYTTHWEHHHQDAVLLNLFVPENDTSIPSKDVGLTLLRRIKRIAGKKPVCVGFGVSTESQVKQIAKVADGVIVGSRIVKIIEKNLGKKDLIKKVSSFVSRLAKATNQKGDVSL